MKSYLEQALASGAGQGQFTLLVFLFDQIRKVSVDWQVKERETISVPFGRMLLSIHSTMLPFVRKIPWSDKHAQS